MRIIAPSVEIMRSGLEKEFIRPEQHIEKVGRTCYKSEDKITEESAAKFVSGLVKRGHEAMIEHYSPIFKTDAFTYESMLEDWDMLLHNSDIYEASNIKGKLRPFLRFTDQQLSTGEMRCIVSGNMRAWRDFVRACVECYGFVPQYLHGIIRCYNLFFPEFQEYIPIRIMNDKLIPVEVRELTIIERMTHQDVTVKFTCDRGVSHEIVRHRVASFAQESTRYCNYGLDKFGNEITVIRPSWCNCDEPVYFAWKNGCESAEKSYFELMEVCTPQEARSVLPNSLKTEVIVTMNLSGWNHFFDLRCAKDAHPDIQEVANMAKQIMQIEKIEGID